MPLIVNALLIVGIWLLFTSLLPIMKLTGMLPAGRLRGKWHILTTLIVFFIAGYLVYYLSHRAAWRGPLDLIVPAIFFLGACFVLLVSTLSLQTTQHIRRIADLEHENVTDSLTGIYNRRYMERRLHEEVARARRYHLPLAVLLLDVDHFKMINDTYGHPMGDQVLVQLGKMISHTVRETDTVARYGGDEILVIAPNTSRDSAVELSARLRRALREPVIGLHGEDPLRVEVSIGIAIMKKGECDKQAFLNLADTAMYQAKREGRNRVVVHEAPPSVSLNDLIA